LLEYNTETRISAEDALNDPWFVKMLGNEKVDTNLSRNVMNNLKTFRVTNIWEDDHLSIVG